jgi:NADH-quinone oxidoreductase subunit J
MNLTPLLAVAAPSANPASNWITLGLFIMFVATTVAGALIAVNTVRIIRSVSGLALACVGLAGLFYFLHSPFLALMEILIYIGAVCVTIIFGVMLAEPDEPAPETHKRPYPVIAPLVAIVIAAGIFGGLAKLALGHKWEAPVAKINDGSVAAIGTSLLSTYSMAFELISLVLLVAILGALVIARGGRTKE